MTTVWNDIDVVVVATHNRGKAKEFADMLGGESTNVEQKSTRVAGEHVSGSSGERQAGSPAARHTIKWRDLSAFPGVGEVEETGHTFRANACLKAGEYARRTGHWALADDSGLEVDALDGKPGVVSARWAALHDSGSGDAANNALLLRQLADVPDAQRLARFVCVLALADPQGRIILTARDTMEGRIIRQPRGANGFGYDPLFEVVALGKTTAELTAAEKARVSHRGGALRRLKALLQQAAAGADRESIS